ncbi:MAG: alanine racemase [Deltaproteobacteria bacterium]|nr:alanine racemase [Deltaproteobacteria bacterium]
MAQKPQTCAEINLGNLLENLKAIQDHVAPSRVIPVIKADAYGHGAIPVAKAITNNGFFVEDKGAYRISRTPGDLICKRI